MSADGAPLERGPLTDLGLWPFERDLPDRVMLGVREGVEAKSAPPVRIFLGTEEAQYRAERVFFYSIEKVRDPARVYEVYLMKNLKGFDRRHWRTGFTNYRYAIPDFAGGSGKAIYNDVDQIYLTDPAELFDLEMGGHGYLAISSRDTSVMLMDCARMQPMWNRTRASTGNKYSLLNGPSKISGLWGALDGHWNARDLEYVEGRTKCLHFTALHQQPWQPFPEHYSYHPNPLGYLWHDLEKEADETGFEIFDRHRPSPQFKSAIDVAASKDQLSKTTDDAPKDALRVTLHASDLSDANELAGNCLDLSADRKEWPTNTFDKVIVSDVLDRVPPGDLGWIIDVCFRAAKKSIELEVLSRAHRNLGSARWWQDRIALAARLHPAIDWRLNARDNDPIRAHGAAFSYTRRRLHRRPRVWVLANGQNPHAENTIDLARALDWPFEVKPDAPSGHPGEPGLVISSAPLTALDGQLIKKRAPDIVRHVHVGQPRMAVEPIDLLLTTTGDGIPARPNVVHLAAPPIDTSAQRLEEAELSAWQKRLANLPRPITALCLGNALDGGETSLSLLTSLLASLRSEPDPPGSFLVHIDDDVSQAHAQRFGLAFGDTVHLIERDTSAGLAFVELADDVVAIGADGDILLCAVSSGRLPRVLVPEEEDAKPSLFRTITNLRHIVFGGGTTYRGTPHQQHWPARLVDSAIVKGWIKPEANPKALWRDLEARGLCRIGMSGEPVSRPKPLVDLERAREAVERMMFSTQRAG